MNESFILKKNRINRVTTGTREWSDYSVNCITGCSNNCRYCYAKKIAIRFKHKTNSNWKKMEIRINDLNKNYNKRKGRFMFPTSHDITDKKEVLSACTKVLENILLSGNKILITTKPRINVIKFICEKFNDFKEQIQFRFTITSDVDELIKFWEPNAPLFEERLNAIQLGFENYFKTSISVEPFLSDPILMIKKLIPFVSESIWIGPMNYIRRNNLKDYEIPYYEKIRNLQTPENLLKYYKLLKKNHLIRFKDSYLIRLRNSSWL